MIKQEISPIPKRWSKRVTLVLATMAAPALFLLPQHSPILFIFFPLFPLGLGYFVGYLLEGTGANRADPILSAIQVVSVFVPFLLYPALIFLFVRSKSSRAAPLLYLALVCLLIANTAGCQLSFEHCKQVGTGAGFCIP